VKQIRILTDDIKVGRVSSEQHNRRYGGGDE
jgi:hypothetical protein